MKLKINEKFHNNGILFSSHFNYILVFSFQTFFVGFQKTVLNRFGSVQCCSEFWFLISAQNGSFVKLSF